MSNLQRLCPVSEVTTSGQAYTISLYDGEAEIFLFRRNGHIYAYRNSCPHTGVSLNWLPGQFFNVEDTLLQCAMHGALFVPETGQCVSGPCIGDSLQTIEFRQENDILYVDNKI